MSRSGIKFKILIVFGRIYYFTGDEIRKKDRNCFRAFTRGFGNKSKGKGLVSPNVIVGS